MADSKFRTGVDAAKSGGGGSFSRVGYFSLKPGEEAYVQFVTDPWEWITVDQHAMTLTKAKPDDYEGQWPATINTVCRNTMTANGEPLVGDCYVCQWLQDHPDAKNGKRQSRTWALGVMREEVRGDGSPENGGVAMMGKRRGFRNKMTEISILDANGKATANKEMRPEVVIFNMGWKNFFAAVHGTAQQFGGSISNLTFVIAREGEGLATTYHVTQLGPGKQDFSLPQYAERLGIKIDPAARDEDGNPIKVYPPEYDLEKMVSDRASDDYYARFVDPTKPYPKKKKEGEEEAPVAPKPSNDVAPEQLNDMRSRIMSYSEQSAPAAPAPVAAAPTVEDDLDPVGSGEGLIDLDEA